MKVRLGFVTNSSSSSFVIAKRFLDRDQIQAIKEHDELGEKLGLENALTDSWYIEENEEYISAHTFCDNFDFAEFLDIIGVPAMHVHWDYRLSYFDQFDSDTDEQIDYTNWRSLL